MGQLGVLLLLPQSTLPEPYEAKPQSPEVSRRWGKKGDHWTEQSGVILLPPGPGGPREHLPSLSMKAAVLGSSLPFLHFQLFPA